MSNIRNIVTELNSFKIKHIISFTIIFFMHKTILILILFLQHRANKWAQTAVKYSTDKPQRLPIIDIGFKDIGQRNQEFGIDLGPVCFS